MNGKRHSSRESLPSPRDIAAIVSQGEPATLVRWADTVGKHIQQQKLTTNQIRNVFGTVRQIEMNWDADPRSSYRQTVLLKPKLAYYAARERGRGMSDLEKVLGPAIDEIMAAKDDGERRERFMRFAEFFEAILAYHKKYGGK